MLRSLLPLWLLLAPVAHATETVTEVSQVPSAEPESPPSGDFRAPGRSRYLLGHSGMMLRRGEGFVSQKELFYTVASVGVTDHVTVTLGSVLPGLLQGRNGFNFVGGVKVGGSLSERLHLAAGLEMAVLPFMGSGFGLAYGSFTYGTPDAHVTVGAGVTPLFYTNQVVPAALVVGNASGNLRLMRDLALVTEHWAYFTPYPLVIDKEVRMINTLALRIMGQHWSVDLGAAHIQLERPLFLPWADLTWHWG